MFLLAVVSLVLLGGSFLVSVANSRAYLQEQLSAHAEDTATSLSLSLASVMERHDKALTDTMVNAIFDRGYYRRILVLDNHGVIVARRESAANVAEVPSWFIRFVVLTPPQAVSDIGNGWRISGQLIVESHPGFAYRDLWRIAQQELSLYLSVFVCVAVAGYFALRWITRPLAEMEGQAEAIYRRDFREIAVMPRTRELRRVVMAMNRMTRQLSELFSDLVRQVENLRQQAFVDSTTGLANQAAFDAQFRTLLSNSERRVHGALIILQLDDFAGVNSRLGRDQADQLLIQVASRFLKLQENMPETLVARRNGADFVAFVPSVDEPKAQECLKQLMDSVAALPTFRAHPEIRFFTGMAYADVASEPGELLPKASVAVRLARHSEGSGSHVLKASTHRRPELSLLGNSLDEWRSTLDYLLQREDIRLFYQPCVEQNGRLLHKEVLVRLERAGQVVAASAFIPLIEQFGWESRLDRLVVRNVVSYQSEAESLGIPMDVISVNLSPYSLLSNGFIEELQALLISAGSCLPYLQFEISESALTLAPQAVRRLARWLEQGGAGLMLDRFSMRQNSLSMLGSLPLRGLKVDAALVRDVETNPDNRFLLTTLRYVAHSRDMLLLADSVESSSQWQVMRDLKVDGGQGFLFGRPRPLEELPRGAEL